MSDQPMIVSQPFCARHRADLIGKELRLGPMDSWIPMEVTAMSLMFTRLTTNKRFRARVDGGGPSDYSLVLAEIGCGPCFFPEGYQDVVRVCKKGLSHAAQVAQGKVKDPDWPLDRWAAELREGE
jgi:hypothetical protein